MTKIECAIEGDEFSIVAHGHAGFAQIGNDIVCAGISTLLQTLTSYLPEITDTFSDHIESGELWCYAQGKDALKCFNTILYGLKILEENFPGYLQITEGCTIKRNFPL